jgi:hypothetical protein
MGQMGRIGLIDLIRHIRPICPFAAEIKRFDVILEHLNMREKVQSLLSGLSSALMAAAGAAPT